VTEPVSHVKCPSCGEMLAQDDLGFMNAMLPKAFAWTVVVAACPKCGAALGVYTYPPPADQGR